MNLFHGTITNKILNTGKTGNLLALGAGALLPLAFAPYHLFPLAVISPALLFALW